MGTDNLISKLYEGQNQGMNVSNIVGGKREQATDKTAFLSYLHQESAGGMDLTEDKSKFSSTFEGSKESYDRYQYRTAKLDSKNSNMKTEDSLPREEMETFSKDVVHAVSEQLDVPEEKVTEVMQMLGFTVIDLLNPQFLAELTVNLLDASDASALLLDSRFQLLLGQVTELGNDLMERLELDVDQMKELLSQFEAISQTEALDFSKMLNENMDVVASSSENELEGFVPETQTLQTEVDNQVVSMGKATFENNKADVDNVWVEDDVVLENVQFEEQGTFLGRQLETGNEAMEENGSETQEQQNMMFGSDPIEKTIASEDKDATMERGHMGMEHVHAENQNIVSNDSVISQTTGQESYISIDTVQVIEQIVERVRVNNIIDAPSIEMQLNPENLGKLYVNISSKQGVVNAQIVATNENVKEALETQIVELRQTLNQAGVKVDAIEVTVASHEFERNLEQGQSREEQEAERQEELKTKNRRNIETSSIEELSGVMSEEEALIAQIMKDNGNSVDYMA